MHPSRALIQVSFPLYGASKLKLCTLLLHRTTLKGHDGGKCNMQPLPPISLFASTLFSPMNITSPNSRKQHMLLTAGKQLLCL